MDYARLFVVKILFGIQRKKNANVLGKTNTTLTINAYPANKTKYLMDLAVFVKKHII